MQQLYKEFKIMIRLTGFVGRAMYIAKLNSEVTVKHHTPEHKIDKIINTAHTHACTFIPHNTRRNGWGRRRFYAFLIFLSMRCQLPSFCPVEPCIFFISSNICLAFCDFWSAFSALCAKHLNSCRRRNTRKKRRRREAKKTIQYLYKCE